MRRGYIMSIFFTISIFFILSLINVILSTIKSIITVKGTAFQSALINAMFYGFYTIIIKQISDTNLFITIPIIILTNFIGVYMANGLLKLFKKDKLWRITCQIKNSQTEYNRICKELKDNNIEFGIIIDTDIIRFDVLSENQKISKQLKTIFKDNLTYVIEIEKSL